MLKLYKIVQHIQGIFPPAGSLVVRASRSVGLKPKQAPYRLATRSKRLECLGWCLMPSSGPASPDGSGKLHRINIATSAHTVPSVLQKQATLLMRIAKNWTTSKASANQSCSRIRSTTLHKCMGLTEVHRGSERTASGGCFRAGDFEAVNRWQYHQRHGVGSEPEQLQEPLHD